MEFNQKPLLNLTTLAIVPQPKEGKKFGSFVLEKNQEYFTDVSPKQFVDRGCLFYGSSLRGRLEGKQLTVNVSYRSLTNQVLRTAQYRHLLMERITKPQESD